MENFTKIGFLPKMVAQHFGLPLTSSSSCEVTGAFSESASFDKSLSLDPDRLRELLEERQVKLDLLVLADTAQPLKKNT